MYVIFHKVMHFFLFNINSCKLNHVRQRFVHSNFTYLLQFSAASGPLKGGGLCSSIWYNGSETLFWALKCLSYYVLAQWSIDQQEYCALNSLVICRNCYLFYCLNVLSASGNFDWFSLNSFDQQSSVASSCPFIEFQVGSSRQQYESMASLAFAKALQLLVVATEKSSDAFQLRPRGAIYPSIYLLYTRIYLSIRLSIKCDRCDHIAVHTVHMIWCEGMRFSQLFCSSILPIGVDFGTIFFNFDKANTKCNEACGKCWKCIHPATE